MRRGDLPVFVLQNVSVRALKHAGPRSREALVRCKARSVLSKLAPTPTGLDANHLDARIAQKLVEQPNGIRAASHASDQMRWQALFRCEDLLAGFTANHRMKIPHHH